MNIGFPVEKTVKERYSVRTYSKQPVSNDLKEKILSYADSLQNPFGPKIRFKFIEKNLSENGEKLGTYGFIKGAVLYLGAAVNKEKCSQEALGYDFEQLILYITSLGLGTCWLGGTFNKGAFAQEMELKENELFSIITPVGYPASRLRLTEKIFRQSLKADNRLDWDELFFENDLHSPLEKEKSGEYAFALEMLRLSPSAKNKQPWKIVFDGKAFHFIQLYAHEGSDGSGQEMHRIDMGIALSHFHLAVIEKNLSGRFEKCGISFELEEGNSYITSWIID